ncbi:MAG: hypothetical protein WBG65_05760 [Sulfurimonadaceae bacterium]
MSDENEELSDHEKSASIWQNGKSIGNLASSTSNMAQVRKDIIKFALGFEIKDIRTYAGYKGDLLVEIMATDLDVLSTIKGWAENLGMETVLKENPMTMIHELFCITPDEDVYQLVEP